MNGYTIDRAIRSDPLSKSFLGVFSQNNCPDIRPNISFVANLSNSDDPIGSHWVYCHTLISGQFSLECSFSTKITECPDLHKKVLRYTDKIIHMSRSLQSSYLHSCGCWVLQFAFFSYRKIFGNELIEIYYSPKLPEEKNYIYDIFTVFLAKTLFKLKKSPEELLLDLPFLEQEKKINEKK